VMGYKKKAVVVTPDLLALVAEKTKVSKYKEKFVVKSESKGSDDEDISDLKKITALLTKAFNRKKYYAKPTNNNFRTSSASSSANKKPEYVKSEEKKEDKKADEKKHDMNKVKMLLAKKDGDEQVLLAEDQAWMGSISDSDQEINSNMVFMGKMEKVLSYSEESSSSAEETIVEHIVSQKDHDESEFYHNDSEEKDHLVDKLIKTFNQKIAKCQKRIEKANQQSKDLENQNNEFNEQIKVLNEKNDELLAQTEVLQEQLKFKHVVIDTHTECQAQYAKLEEERYQYMIRYSALCDNDKQHRKKIDEQENLFDKMSRQLVEMNNNKFFSDDYFQEIINLDFEKIDSPFQQTSSLKQYVSTVILEKIIIDLEDEVVSLLEKEKENLEIIESLKSKGFESSENAISESENQSENDCQVVEKGCDNLENTKVIAPEMFKINVSQTVSPISVSKTSSDSNNVENKPKRKRRKRTSSKENDKQVNNDVLRANRDFVHFSYLDTLSSVRRPKHKGVIWKKKGSSNTSSVDLSSVSNLKLDKDVKRYSRKDLLSCNNSHHVDTRSAYACNDAMNVSCNPRLYASYYVNDLFVFDDIVQICLWILDSGCSKHTTGNRALLMNFVEKFLGTVRFGNNDFAVIDGYGDVVIRSMTIKKVYYVEGLGHNVFSVGKFCDKGLDVAFRKSSCFVRTEDGVDLLTDDPSSNLYTIALNDIASNSLAYLLAKASSSQSWLWHQRLSHLNFATINNLVKNTLVRGLPKMKFEKDHLCSACEQGKIHQKHHKSKTDFASNKPLYLLHMDLGGPMRVESINGKRYVLVVVDDYSRCYLLNDYDDVGKVKEKGDIGVFVGYSKECAAFRITKSPTTNVETSNNKISSHEGEVFHEVSESFQEESSQSSLNEDVQQSLKE
ncbi:retrovirus-related pol polyprotein from transposon TNT 1-94, partial [Tanacetum coccineum]